MPNSNVTFQGQTLPIPGSYYADNVSATIPANPALIPPLIFIGYGYGGTPDKAYNFSGGQGLQALQQFVRGGPCAGFVPFIANPSPVLFGASQVTYINPAKNTQSTLTLVDVSGRPVIDLTSADYGPPSNLLQAEVETGTIAGFALELFDGYSGTNAAQVDNLGYPFQLAYTGAATGAAWVVASTSGTGASSLTLTAGSGSTPVVFPLGGSQYGTVQQLVQAINGSSIPFTAQVLPNQSNAQQPTTTLDAASGVLTASGSGSLNFAPIPGITGGITYWVNTFANDLATAAKSPTASGATVYTLSGIPFTHFTGATTVAPQASDYAAAFNVAAAIPGWVVCCDTNDAAVMALGVQHAFDMSQPSVGKPRRFISGSSIAETVSDAQAAARSMAIYQGSYVYPGIYATDTNTGINTLYGGVYAAAAVASMMAGNIIAQPLTNQQLFGNGVERTLTPGAGGEIDSLQQAGVMPIFISPTTGEPTIVSDFTTWQTDNNPENVFNQQVACRQALAYSLSQGLAPYIGSIASPFGLTNIKNATKSILNQLIYSPGNNGILISWDSKSLSITYDGSRQAVSLTVNVVFVGQVRFILELVFVQPLNLTA